MYLFSVYTMSIVSGVCRIFLSFCTSRNHHHTFAFQGIPSKWMTNNKDFLDTERNDVYPSFAGLATFRIRNSSRCFAGRMVFLWHVTFSIHTSSSSSLHTLFTHFFLPSVTERLGRKSEVRRGKKGKRLGSRIDNEVCARAFRKLDNSRKMERRLVPLG